MELLFVVDFYDLGDFYHFFDSERDAAELFENMFDAPESLQRASIAWEQREVERQIVFIFDHFDQSRNARRLKHVIGADIVLIGQVIADIDLNAWLVSGFFPLFPFWFRSGFFLSQIW